MIQQTSPCPFAFVKESQLKLELDFLLEHEEPLWRSKSRETWLTCKDLNTKYFHISTLIRRMPNSINFLKSNTGDWVSSRVDIGGIFIDHFKHLFSSSNPSIEEEILDLFSPVISIAENLSFCSIPSKLEIFQALASLGSSKAPGSDGFTAFFTKKYWSLIKVDVLNWIMNFFNNNCLLRNQNHTFLALIPKSSGSHFANQFRPISLCNIVYKIISKILANRLKPLLAKFIFPLQSAFIPNRNCSTPTLHNERRK